ncbi:MAG: hypothetical protein RL113_590 [Pseudomonadota bacterium]
MKNIVLFTSVTAALLFTGCGQTTNANLEPKKVEQKPVKEVKKFETKTKVVKVSKENCIPRAFPVEPAAPATSVGPAAPATPAPGICPEEK